MDKICVIYYEKISHEFTEKKTFSHIIQTVVVSHKNIIHCDVWIKAATPISKWMKMSKVTVIQRN